MNTIRLAFERTEGVAQDVARRGRDARLVAGAAVDGVVRRCRREVEQVVSDCERLLGLGGDDPAVPPGDESGRRAANLPLARYGDLKAGQIVARLDDMTPAELRKLRDYERLHAGRKTILGAVDERLA